MNASIQKRILEYEDFEFAVSETESLINKRPIAFKDSLRDLDPESFALTPEMVIKGYSTVVMNIIPELQPNPGISSEDKVWTMDNKKCIGPNGVLMNRYEKLRKVRENIRGHYHDEFLAHLIMQAVDRKGRYYPVSHTKLEVGDLVSIKQPFSKPLQYPMGIVKSISTNELGETVSAKIMKGNKQVITKHVSDLVLLLKADTQGDKPITENVKQNLKPQIIRTPLP